MANQQLSTRHLLGIKYITPDDIDLIFETTDQFKEVINRPIKKVPSLRDVTIANLFFENSTRTRISFELAERRLSADTINFSASSSSVSKGETLLDTVNNILSMKVDMVVIRHPAAGVPIYLSKRVKANIINAGDGSNQHPTQCLLDLFTIRQTQGTLDNLDIAFVGDLKYGRTIHSNVIALSHFNTTFHLVSPEELKLPSAVKMHIKSNNLQYFQYTDLEEVIPKVDIIYMTRIQRERFADPIEYERVKNSYTLTKKMLEGSRENLKILHPLPRVNEISVDVDLDPRAYYFKQALNGVYIRQALIASILGLA